MQCTRPLRGIGVSAWWRALKPRQPAKASKRHKALPRNGQRRLPSALALRVAPSRYGPLTVGRSGKTAIYRYSGRHARRGRQGSLNLGRSKPLPDVLEIRHCMTSRMGGSADRACSRLASAILRLLVPQSASNFEPDFAAAIAAPFIRSARSDVHRAISAPRFVRGTRNETAVVSAARRSPSDIFSPGDDRRLGGQA